MCFIIQIARSYNKSAKKILHESQTLLYCIDLSYWLSRSNKWTSKFLEQTFNFNTFLIVAHYFTRQTFFPNEPYFYIRKTYPYY